MFAGIAGSLVTLACSESSDPPGGTHGSIDAGGSGTSAGTGASSGGAPSAGAPSAGGMGGSPTSSGGSSPVGTGGSPSVGGGTSVAGSGGASAGAPASGGSGAGGTEPASGGTASGGSAPTAGAGGASGSPGSSGEGGQPSGGAGGSGSTGKGFFVEDFESSPTGKAPMGWDTFLDWNKNPTSPTGSTVVVDESKPHGGSRSLHVKGSPAQITRPLPANTNKLYVRAWFWFSRQLGNHKSSESPSPNHETLIAIRKTSGSASDEIRFGEIKGVIGTNEVPSDNIAPKMDQWYQGPSVPAGSWACIEVAFLADTPIDTLHAWANGTLVHEITSPDQWQNGTLPSGWMMGQPANWMDGYFVEVVLGWHSFSSAENELWIDDIVLSNERIGCE